MKTLVKFFLTGLALWVFTRIGWIEVDGGSNELLITLFILSLVIWLAMTLAFVLYAILAFMTLGIGILLLPFFLGGVGFFVFWIIQQVLPGWLILNTGFWGIVLMSFVLGIIYFIQQEEALVKIKIWFSD